MFVKWHIIGLTDYLSLRNARCIFSAPTILQRHSVILRAKSSARSVSYACWFEITTWHRRFVYIIYLENLKIYTKRFPPILFSSFYIISYKIYYYLTVLRYFMSHFIRDGILLQVTTFSFIHSFKTSVCPELSKYET